jgi:hypothetical protein
MLGSGCRASAPESTFFPQNMSTDQPNKVIYSMMGVGKTYDRKVVLRDISLS